MFFILPYFFQYKIQIFLFPYWYIVFIISAENSLIILVINKIDYLYLYKYLMIYFNFKYLLLLLFEIFR